MFRVYDNKKKCWVKDNIYLTPDDELVLIKESAFGMVKTPIELSKDRYICHRDIGLTDKTGREVFEGDYVKASVSEDNEEIGLVTYAYQLSAYIILCVNNDTFYTLGTETSDDIQVIGNVFDGYEE